MSLFDLDDEYLLRRIIAIVFSRSRGPVNSRKSVRRSGRELTAQILAAVELISPVLRLENATHAIEISVSQLMMSSLCQHFGMK
jgi:hypothetical protein